MRCLTAAAATPGHSEGAKAWRNVQAELLLGGFRADLLETDNGEPELVVSRWTVIKRFSDLDDARTWASTALGRRKGLDVPPPAQDVRHSPWEAAHAPGLPAAG